MNYCDKHRVGYDSTLCPYCVGEATEKILQRVIIQARYLKDRPPYIV